MSYLLNGIDIDDIIKALLGSEDDLYLILAEFGLYSDELTEEDTEHILNNVYQCEGCATWVYVGEECC